MALLNAEALAYIGRSSEFELACDAVEAGAVVIDNSSAFRMDPNVPLVVPEVNEADLEGHQGIIANPNCVAAPLVVALKPIADAVGLERVIVSSYQSVSGTGAGACAQAMLIHSPSNSHRHARLLIGTHRLPWNAPSPAPYATAAPDKSASSY
jgi:aspartate-semialdehyde dehydrogenase